MLLSMLPAFYCKLQETITAYNKTSTKKLHKKKMCPKERNTHRTPIDVSKNLEHLYLTFCFPFVFVYMTERRMKS